MKAKKPLLYILIFIFSGNVLIAESQQEDMSGEYLGKVWSGGELLPIKTIFKIGTRNNLSGTYEIEEKERVISGVIRACEEVNPSQFKCIWQDEYGYGDFNFIINGLNTQFYGYWNEIGDKGQYIWHGEK
ncbi:hypothetical protein HXW73_12475 [Halomonas sp. SH5A2]|uniref:hypothetical protein n=1 Tax=Halomonas sp. SH5A2 TaxID=2749040 RepID=UPI00164197BD|nr:hypothetical protein [Halomonas sp. SH5A2]QNI03676.1 hypothetical protein HXW73_12475 [Halomonas sp. SH5A2]